MKKLIISILSLFLLMGCGYATMNFKDKMIIKEIQVTNGNLCRYYGHGDGTTLAPTSTYFQFTDTCGKFQIGDTVYLIKK